MNLKNREIGFVVLILIVGAFLRFKGIFDQSFAFTYDVGRDLLAVQKIVQDHDLLLIGPTTGLAGLFYGPWWYYFLTPSFILGGGNPQYVVGFIAFTGLVTVILGYVFGRGFSSYLMGAVFALLLAFSPVLISITSQLWNPNIAPILLVILFILLYQFLQNVLNKKKNKKENVLLMKYLKETSFTSFLIGLVSGFSIDSEIVYGSLLTFATFLFLFFVLIKKKILRNIIFYFAGLFVVFSPRIIFELKNGFLMTGHLLGWYGETPHGSVFTLLPIHFSNVLIALKTLWDETLALNNQFGGWILLIFVIGILIKYFHIYTELQKTFLFYIFTVLSVFIFGLSFFNNEIWGHYIVGIPVIFLFLLSLALSTLYQHVAINKRYSILAAFCLYSILLLQPVQIVNYFTKPQWIGDASVYRNNLTVVDYIYKEAAGRQFNYLLYTPPVHDYTYQYLFSWYGRDKYSYTPSQKTEKLLFVILESDEQDPSRREAWLKVRENDGTVVKEEVLVGNLTVQKRIR